MWATSDLILQSFGEFLQANFSKLEGDKVEELELEVELRRRLPRSGDWQTLDVPLVSTITMGKTEATIEATAPMFN